MESAEIEALVVELETRVDRLRSLYDMYFMGIERLEPLVPRKDVERRLQQLRKEQIRNTGTRFRFQMIVQRYNTYITYWQRISRQIEQGTYKRDVMRAQARFGVNPAKERAQPRDEPDEAVTEPRRAAHVIEEDLSEDISMSLEDDLLSDIQALPPRGAPAAAAPPAPERFVSGAKLELDDFADPFEELDPFPKPMKTTPPKVRIAPRAGGPAAPSVPVPAAPLDSRDTDRRIAVAAAHPPATVSMRPEPRVIVAKRASIPDAHEVGRSVPAPPPSAPRIAPVARPVSPVVATRPGAATNTAPPRPPAPAPAPPRPPTAAAAPSPPRPAPAAPVLSSPAVAKPAPAAAAPAARAAPAAPVASTRPPVAAPPPSQPQPRPPQAQAPAPSPQARPAVAAPPQPARQAGDLSGDRFGQIYSQYVETRRKQNEPTGAITRDALAKQLDESTTRLKQKHAGKAIDFEVVVKDGRTILRPVVK